MISTTHVGNNQNQSTNTAKFRLEAPLVSVLVYLYQNFGITEVKLREDGKYEAKIPSLRINEYNYTKFLADFPQLIPYNQFSRVSLTFPAEIMHTMLIPVGASEPLPMITAQLLGSISENLGLIATAGGCDVSRLQDGRYRIEIVPE